MMKHAKGSIKTCGANSRLAPRTGSDCLARCAGGVTRHQMGIDAR